MKAFPRSCVWFLTAVSALLLVACDHRPPPIPPLITGPPVAQQPSAAPTLANVQHGSAQADTQSAIAAGKVDSATQAASDAQSSLQAMTVEVDLLVKKHAATESELLKFYNQLVALEARQKITLADLSDAKAALASEKELRELASVQLSAAVVQVNAKDTEAVELRRNLTVAEADAKAQHKAAEDYNQLSTKETARADKAEGASALKNKLMLGMGVVILVLGLLVAALFKGIIPI